MSVKCTSAVDYIEKRLDKLHHPDAGFIKPALWGFNHSNPTLDKFRRQMAEAIIIAIEEEHVIGPKTPV